MKRFINSQIDSFNNKKYDISDYHNILEKYPLLLFIKIKNNKFESHHIQSEVKYIEQRIAGVKSIFKLLLEIYKLPDTQMYIYVGDMYFWEEDLPVFCWSIPIGIQGLIFPNPDILNYNIKNKKYNFDKVKKKCKKYEPSEIKYDIYFIGKPTSDFRISMASKYSLFDIDISEKNIPIYKFKKHKYLLDFSGRKSWSTRLKYLFCMDRMVIRVSEYNSSRGEKGYWRQWFDYIFEQNKDYVHLVYDEVNTINITKIKNDILDTYKISESEPISYKNMVDCMNRKSKKLNIKNTLKYLYRLICSYTKHILVD
jgi:hypothetical protein